MKKRLMGVRRISLTELVRESFSFNIFKNKYIWFGFLIGLLFSLVCLVPWSSSGASKCGAHWFLLGSPFIMALIFGCLGTFKIMKEVEAESYRMLYKIRVKSV